VPIIEMYVQQGALDGETKRKLHESVGRIVLEIEGASFDDSQLARELTWMFIREQPPGSFSVGGEAVSSDDEPRFFTRVSTPQGALDPERRAAVAKAVHHAIARAIGRDPSELGPFNQFCWIDETCTVSGGGRVVTFGELMGLLGLTPA
jgi:phenylpyruvate tautomerase PptA (4-oxalocrotonate tautomerase family)